MWGQDEVAWSEVDGVGPVSVLKYVPRGFVSVTSQQAPPIDDEPHVGPAEDIQHVAPPQQILHAVVKAAAP